MFISGHDDTGIAFSNLGFRISVIGFHEWM